MSDSRTIEKTVRNNISFGLAVVLVGCFLAEIIFDIFHFRDASNQKIARGLSILFSLVAAVWLGLMQLWPSLSLEEVAWMKYYPFTLCFLAVIVAQASIYYPNPLVMAVCALFLVLDICFIWAATMDVESKSLFTRVFRPFRKEVLTIIPISRPSSPTSSV